jgi:hypothetical protein
LERVRINRRAASVGIARALPKGRYHGLLLVAAFLGCILMGCSTGSSSDSSPAPPASSSTRPPSIPSDGITLAELGFLNGPIQQFSLPRTAFFTAKVDQPNNVAVVVSSPSPTDIANYLRRALPAAGFTITADSPRANTLSFDGHGWSGSFTADNRASAILLRPQ